MCCKCFIYSERKDNTIMKVISSLKNLTRFEIVLWGISVVTVGISFLSIKGQNPLSLLASLIGVTALIFVAKGDVLGQILTVIFGVLYAVISYSFRYYGEMITYLCMTAPMAVLSVIVWLKNPYSKDKQEVRVNHLKQKDIIVMCVYTVLVTILFYFILAYFKTNNLLISTLSITTSFLASYLTYKRSPFYALAYAANDIVLIVLWIWATIHSKEYLPMIICFLMFLANDIYGFINWRRIERRQTLQF